MQWYSAKLAAACTDLREDATLATAGSLYQFGVQGRNVSHCFEPMEGNPRTHGRLGILTSIAEERRSCLAGDLDEVWQIMPVEKRDKRGGTDAVPKYVHEQGWTLAAQRFSATSSRTASQYTAEQALGTAYVAIRTDTSDEAKTLNRIRLAGDSSTNTGINSRNGLGTLEVPNGNGAVSCIGSIGASPLRVTIPAWVGRS